VGNVHRSAGRLDEAYAQYELCLKNREARDPNYKSRLDDMQDLCEIRLAQKRFEDAMQLALTFWRGTVAAPEARADAGHMSYAAALVMKCWKELQAAHPTAQEPEELQAARAALQMVKKPTVF
jgi:hypothetical protein